MPLEQNVQKPFEKSLHASDDSSFKYVFYPDSFIFQILWPY